MRLDIVVAPGCTGCDEARATARAVQAQLPGLHVTVIELDGRRPPDRVVATPTYLLDGAVVSLGNPRAADLIKMIQRRASAPGENARPSRRRWCLPRRWRTA